MGWQDAPLAPEAETAPTASSMPEAPSVPSWRNAPLVNEPQSKQEEPSSWADVAKTIPSGLARGVSSAIGLPGEVGHGMRYLTDQAKQYLGYPANPDYVAGTGKYADALAFSPETKDVQSFIEKGTGPLYEPKTTAGRYANAAAEIAGGSAIPFGGASSGYAAELTPYVANWLASSVGAGTANEAAKDLGAPPIVQAGAGLAGGLLAPRAINSAFAKGTPDPRMIEKTEAAEAAQQEGISVPKAAVAGSMWKPVAGRVASLPIVGAPLQNAARTSLDQTANRVEDIANLYGAGNRAGAGEHLRDAIVDYMNTGSREPINRLYDKVDNLVDDTQPHQLLNTSALAHTLRRAQTAAQRATNEAALGPIAEDLENQNGLTYSGIKELRTKIGGMLDDNLLPQAGTTKPVLKRIYGALTKDLRSAVQTNGNDALEAFDRANKLNEVVATRREELQRIVGKAGGNAGENVFETMLQMASDTGKSANIERLRLARKAAGPQTWDDFTSAFVRRMGENPKTGDFSPDRFLTAYGKLSPEGKQLLFNSTGRGDLAQSLERLKNVSEQFSEFYKMGNPSGTAGATFVTSLFGAGSIGGLLNPLAAIGSFSSLLGMWGAAKYFASPTNVDKMSRTLQARLAYTRNPNPRTEQLAANATASLMESLKPYMQPEQAPQRARGGAVTQRIEKALAARGLNATQISEFLRRGLSGESATALAKDYPSLKPAMIRRLIKAHRADGGSVANEDNIPTIEPQPLLPLTMPPEEKTKYAQAVHRGLDQYLGGIDALAPKSNEQAAEMAAYATPGLGNALSARDAYEAAGNRDWRGAALGAIGAIPLFGGMTRLAEGEGIRAYHGSPHDFEHFDASKIGTGEGAQAYGHGLYFAGDEDVAKYYKNQLSGNSPYKYEDQPSSLKWETSPLDFVDRKDFEKLGAEGALQKTIKRLREESAPFYDKTYNGGSGEPNMYNSAADRLERLDASKISLPGHMYEVNIAASPEHFLDWDKPLSEQSEHVRNALLPHGIGAGYQVIGPDGAIPVFHPSVEAAAEAAKDIPGARAIRPIDPTGGQVMESSKLVPGQYADRAAAAQRLQEAGIPGIKYRDAGSRTALEEADLQRRAADLDRQIGNAQKQLSALPESMATEYKGHIDGLMRERDAVQKKLAPTHNYVVFDDKLISILRKYGIPGAIGLGLITPELGRQMQEQGLAFGGSVSDRLSKALRSRGLNEAQINELFHRGLSDESAANLARDYGLKAPLVRRLLKAHRAEGGEVNADKLETIEPMPLIPFADKSKLPPLKTPMYGGTLDPTSSGTETEDNLPPLAYAVLARLGIAGRNTAMGQRLWDKLPDLPERVRDVASRIYNSPTAATGAFALANKDYFPALVKAAEVSKFPSNPVREEMEFQKLKAHNRERMAADPEGFMREVNEWVGTPAKEGTVARLTQERYMRSLPNEVLDTLMPRNEQMFLMEAQRRNPLPSKGWEPSEESKGGAVKRKAA